jgi:predicted O-methyltransferase YrrM
MDTPPFRRAVSDLFVPAMGTELVAPLLGLLVEFLRPRSVLEIGMGYTTPFIAAALADTAERVRLTSTALAVKTGTRQRDGRELDEVWLNEEPALAAPEAYLVPYRPRLVAVDNLSNPQSSAGRVQNLLADLGLAEFVQVVNGDLRDGPARLPESFTPIDLAWVDAWECLHYFDHFWQVTNPNGGVIVMHYLMTYPEGEAIIKYIKRFQRRHPDSIEVLNLLEAHKLAQNSVTVLRRTDGIEKRQYAGRNAVVDLRAQESPARAHLTEWERGLEADRQFDGR